MTPEERLLWSAVIAQAVRDARGEGGIATGALPWPGYDTKKEALEWIFGKDTGFELACDFAEANPEWVRRAVTTPPFRTPRPAAGGWNAKKAKEADQQAAPIPLAA
jgi:hypothetical protein